MKSRISSLAILGAFVGAASAMMSPAAMHHAIPTPRVNVSKKHKRTLFGGAIYSQPSSRYHKASGMTTARQQRAAKKLRNRARNKLAIKRAR